jgi:hypothetical protein
MLSGLENDVLGNEVGLKALLIFPHKTGPNRMRGFSVIFRLYRPTWGDLDEQEASYT